MKSTLDSRQSPAEINMVGKVDINIPQVRRTGNGNKETNMFCNAKMC